MTVRKGSLNDLRFLSTILEAFRPEVREYNKFVRDTYVWMGSLVSDPTNLLKVDKMSVGSWGLDTTWISEDETDEVEYPELVNVRLAGVGTILSLSQKAAIALRADLLNPQQFIKSFIAFMASKNGLVFLKILAFRVMLNAKAPDWWDSVTGDSPFFGWFSSKVTKDWNCNNPNPDKVDGLQAVARVTGSSYNIALVARLTFGDIECIHEGKSKDDYDTDHAYDQARDDRMLGVR